VVAVVADAANQIDLGQDQVVGVSSTGWPQMAMLTTVPPRLTVRIAVWKVAGKPAARNHLSVASPIGPAPNTTAVWPGPIRERRTAWKLTAIGSTSAPRSVGSWPSW